MRKILTILGGIFAAIVAVIIIAAVLLIPRALKLDREAVAYLQSALPKIVGQRDPRELSDRASSELLKTVKSKDEMNRLFEQFSKLGALKHLDAPKGAVYSSAYTGAGTVTRGNDTAKAEFEKGSAIIRIQIRRVGGDWKIDGFRIDSDAFLPPKPDMSPKPTPTSI